MWHLSIYQAWCVWDWGLPGPAPFLTEKSRFLLPRVLLTRLRPLHPARLLSFQAVSRRLLCWDSQGSVCHPDLSLGNRTSLLHAMDKVWILQPEVRTRTQLSHSTAAWSRSPSSPALQPEASSHEKALLPEDLAPTPGTSCPSEPRPHALSRCFCALSQSISKL